MVIVLALEHEIDHWILSGGTQALSTAQLGKVLASVDKTWSMDAHPQSKSGPNDG